MIKTFKTTTILTNRVNETNKTLMQELNELEGENGLNKIVSIIDEDEKTILLENCAFVDFGSLALNSEIALMLLSKINKIVDSVSIECIKIDNSVTEDMYTDKVKYTITLKNKEKIVKEIEEFKQRQREKAKELKETK